MLKGYKPITVINHDIRPINPVQCGSHKCQCSYGFGPFVRKYYVLHFVTSGKGIFVSSSRSYEVKAGQMFVIRPGESTYYEADANDPWSYIWIGFMTDMELPKMLSENDVIDAPYLDKFFDMAFHAEGFERNDSGAYEYYLSGIIWMILGHLKRYESGVSHGTDHLKIAVSLMSSENKFKINTIARVLHISRVHLTRLFKEKYGVSPGRFYLRLRMTQAAELLSAGHSVANVASSIGFKDPFVFSRAFKRYYNCSPTEYIKQQNVLSNKNASHK